MSSILTIIEFIFFFGLLIFFHELGHFLSCKALGIEVEEFGFGYPQLDPIWRLCAPQRGRG